MAGPPWPKRAPARFDGAWPGQSYRVEPGLDEPPRSRREMCRFSSVRRGAGCKMTIAKLAKSDDVSME